MLTRLLLNGKKAGQQDIRDAVYQLREEGHDLEVRTTWEGGDIERLVLEAEQQGIDRIIAGGGDGTVNEVVDALLKHSLTHIQVAILPLGTANDFATACDIPTASPYQSLLLALKGNAYRVDAARANERHFINIATAGFGAQITANTPVTLKNLLGGGAYALSGMVQALNFRPFHGTVLIDGKQHKANIVVGALCNGRLAGGGQPLAPEAFLDDGYLDAFSLQGYTLADISKVVEEIHNPNFEGVGFVNRNKVTRLQWDSQQEMPINLDGEPMASLKVVMEVLPKAIKLVLPENTTILKHRELAD
ncbi:lipid kinase [Vibrio sp. qd031]|uniref:lipid kinase YegS n=1 Tax=Vibrio sp. qd031 TaxID=1603038 RepID=UPI000A10F905|nr:lipid kinase YegS [Vibrio sp. qd031]ORT52833.1 lipid kinase [Vibrio sp. qd031]